MGERKSYKPRGKRETYVRRINLQFPRDLDILQDIYRHKALTVHQIHLMHFGSSRSPAQLRLTKLFNHKFIHQIVIPVGYNEPGSNPIFNVMDSKGVELLREYRNPDLKWHYSDKDLTDRFLKHTKLLNEFYATVVRVCRDKGYSYPTYDENNRLIKRTEKELKADRERVVVRRLSGQREAIPFNPDAYLTIDVGGRVFAFFIEADRKTEKGLVIKEKLRAYHAYFESGKYTERYKSKARFRVLFVTIGDKRLASLKQWADEENAGPNFWFTHIKRINRRTALHQPIWSVSGWSEPAAIFRVE